VRKNQIARVRHTNVTDRPDSDVDQLFNPYSSVLHDIADQLAPSHVIRRRPDRPTPWFDAECRAQRRHCRRLERRYRRTCRPDDRRSWVEATRRQFALYRTKKEQYWNNRLLQCGRSSPQLWRSMNSMFERQRDVSSSTSHTAEGFAAFFTALHEMQTRSSDENSVCLSVRLSHAWIVTKR